MPNWCYCKMGIRGKKNDLIAWINKGLANDKREPITEDMSCTEIEDILNKNNLTLESFLPMPQTYHDYDTTNSVDTLYWLNYLLYVGKANKKIQKHFNKWLYGYFGYDNTKMNFVGIERLKKIALAHKMSFVMCTYQYLLNVAENDEELMKEINRLYNAYVSECNAAKVYQQETYGVVGWYDWRCKNFGCKWNANFHDVVLKDIGYDIWVIFFNCETAYSIPSEWLKTIQEENKGSLVFYCRSEEESGLWNGYFCCLESSWREDHDYDEVANDENSQEKWQIINADIDRHFEEDVECTFDTIECL